MANVTSEGVSVLGQSHTPAGSHAIDELLLRDLIHKDSNNDGRMAGAVKRSRRAEARLLSACGRLKKTLSANREATVTVDSLGGGDDVHLTTTRAHLEDLCRVKGGLYDNVQTACREAIESSGVTPDRIQVVEVSHSGLGGHKTAIF